MHIQYTAYIYLGLQLATPERDQDTSKHLLGTDHLPLSMSETGKRPLPLEKLSRTLVLFDVDGTLTAPREEVTKVMKDYLMNLKERVVVGIVGGSDLPKQKEQMGENIVDEVDYSFSENGLVAFKSGSLIGKEVKLNAITIFYDSQSLQASLALVKYIVADWRRLLKLIISENLIQFSSRQFFLTWAKTSAKP